MTRVPLVQDGQNDAFDVLTRRLRSQGKDVPRLMRALGGNVGLLRNWGAYNDTLRFSTSLSATDVEFAILAVSVAAGCRYSFAHHVPLGLDAGITEEQIRALATWRDSDRFSLAQRSVLAAVDDIATDHRASESSFLALGRHFAEPSRVELVQLIAFYFSLAIIAESLAIPPEDDFQAWSHEYWSK